MMSGGSHTGGDSSSTNNVSMQQQQQLLQQQLAASLLARNNDRLLPPFARSQQQQQDSASTNNNKSWPPKPPQSTSGASTKQLPLQKQQQRQRPQDAGSPMSTSSVTSRDAITSYPSVGITAMSTTLSPSPQHFQQQQQQSWSQQQQQQLSQTRDNLQYSKSAAQSDLSKAQETESGKLPLSDQKYAYLLPSTLMPPSVLASVLQPAVKSGSNGSSTIATTDGSNARVGGRYKKKTGRNKSIRLESPQDCLDRILSLQGYGKAPRIEADDAQYETVPSPLQLASFGTELVQAIHTSNVDKLGRLLETGLSPNPCNKFRDSIVDLVCKRANAPIFQCLVDHGCDLRVCDGFGRTPLHHCCWASEFSAEIAEVIIRRDWQQLLIEDKRGQTPLEYVRPDQASDWIEFLEDNRDRFFPIGGSIPPIQSMKNTRPDNHLPDPPNALPIKLAAAVSSGQLSLEELANISPEMRAKLQ